MCKITDEAFDTIESELDPALLSKINMKARIHLRLFE